MPLLVGDWSFIPSALLSKDSVMAASRSLSCSLSSNGLLWEIDDSSHVVCIMINLDLLVRYLHHLNHLVVYMVHCVTIFCLLPARLAHCGLWVGLLTGGLARWFLVLLFFTLPGLFAGWSLRIGKILICRNINKEHRNMLVVRQKWVYSCLHVCIPFFVFKVSCKWAVTTSNRLKPAAWLQWVRTQDANTLMWSLSICLISLVCFYGFRKIT